MKSLEYLVGLLQGCRISTKEKDEVDDLMCG